MGIFSEELAILDKNTVDYMIDEMQDTIDKQQEIIKDLEDRLARRQNHLNQLNQKLIADNRMEDLARAVSDREFQEQLLQEYGLL